MTRARVLGLALALGALLALVLLLRDRSAVPDEGMPLPAPQTESPARATSSPIESGGEQPSAAERAPAAPIPAQPDRDARAATAKGPTLSGSITVDGQRRIPANLVILVNSTRGLAQVDPLTATYLVATPVAPQRVLASSDESRLLELPVPPLGPDGNWHVDLPLVSGRTLYVHALDGRTGAAAPGASLTLQLSILSERTVKMMSFRNQALTATTDPRGDCVFRCLPLEGRATLQESPKAQSQEKPLLELRLTPDSPDEYRETVTLGAARASISGTQPVSPVFRQVLRARIGEGGRSVPVEGAVLADERGHWSFECEAPSDWRVWLADGTVRVSQIEEIHVTDARAYGPIELQLVQEIELPLHFVNAPASGTVNIAIYENDGDPYRYEDVPITARELDHTLRLHGPARLTVRCKAGDQMSVAESRQILSVDPSRTPELTVDLHGDRLHGVTFTLNGEPPRGDSVLPFIGLDSSGNATREGVIFHLLEGKSRDPVPVVAGTYLYILQSDTARGAVYGVLRVPDSAEPAELRIEWKGLALPRASLGTGIELDTVDGVSTSNWIEGLRKLRWPKTWGPEVTSLLVPERAKYRVLN